MMRPYALERHSRWLAYVAACAAGLLFAATLTLLGLLTRSPLPMPCDHRAEPERTLCVQAAERALLHDALNREVRRLNDTMPATMDEVEELARQIAIYFGRIEP